MSITKITVQQPSPSMPEWAVLKRRVIDLMNRSEDIILENYLMRTERSSGPIFRGSAATAVLTTPSRGSIAGAVLPAQVRSTARLRHVDGEL